MAHDMNDVWNLIIRYWYVRLEGWCGSRRKVGELEKVQGKMSDARCHN